MTAAGTGEGMNLRNKAGLRSINMTTNYCIETLKLLVSCTATGNQACCSDRPEAYKLFDDRSGGTGKMRSALSL